MFSSQTFRLVLVALLVVFLVVVSFKYRFVYADEYGVLQSQIDKLNSEINLYSPAQATNKSNLKALQNRVSSLKAQIDSLLIKLEKKQLDINKRNSDFDQEYKKLSLAVRSYYIRSYYPSGLIIILGSQNATDAIRMLGVYSMLSKKDRDIIVGLATILADLQKEKSQLHSQVDTVSAFKKDIDAKAEFLAGEVAKVDAYIGQLQTKIAQLSARQQDILAQRLTGLNIPRSAGTSLRGCVDDRGIDPGFSPRFAFFTYGAPHRKGLNQYGAWGRAKRENQNEEQILQEYYPGKTLKKDYDQNIQITTTDGHTFSIEDYVKRIYEMPDSWTANNLAALKAQAVAARTYALNVTSNGSKQICTSEQCQVFKPDPKGGNWEIAAEATKGWVLMDGDKPAFTQYASTHGGYILNLGKFDGSGGNPGNFNELNERAYDKESPWFYCDWGFRSGYNNTAWLKPAELSDIVNVILLARADSSNGDRLYQTDKAHPYGGEIWNEDRVKQELRNRSITPFNNISDVSIGTDFGSGKTSSISVSGDGGSTSFSGDEFKNFFNLRAPANIQIVGPLFNIEKR